MNSHPTRGKPLRLQRGLSLVELMVGIAVGLFVVAAASMLVSTQLSDNRRLLIDTQLQQDLRAAADLVARELRRSGYWEGANQTVWYAGTPVLAENPRAVMSPAAAPSSDAEYRYDFAPDESGPFRFTLGDNGAIRAAIGGGGLQDLTDVSTMRVTTFTITPVVDGVAGIGQPLRIACPRPCPDGTETCWPTVTVRTFQVDIAARSVADANVTRSIRSRVRVRNDWYRVYDPANPANPGNPAVPCPP